MCSQLDTEGTRSGLTVVRSCAYFSVSVRGRVSDLVGMCSVACLSSVDLISCLARGERGQEGAEGGVFQMRPWLVATERSRLVVDAILGVMAYS